MRPLFSWASSNCRSCDSISPGSANSNLKGRHLLRKDLQQVRHVAELKLQIRAKLIQQGIQPFVPPMSVDQVAPLVGISAAVEGSIQRLSHRFDSARVKAVLDYNIDYVCILFVSADHSDLRNAGGSTYKKSHNMLGIPKKHAKTKLFEGMLGIFPSIYASK